MVSIIVVNSSLSNGSRTHADTADLDRGHRAADSQVAFISRFHKGETLRRFDILCWVLSATDVQARQDLRWGEASVSRLSWTCHAVGLTLLA